MQIVTWQVEKSRRVIYRVHDALPKLVRRELLARFKTARHRVGLLNNRLMEQIHAACIKVEKAALADYAAVDKVYQATREACVGSNALAPELVWSQTGSRLGRLRTKVLYPMKLLVTEHPLVVRARHRRWEAT